LLGARGLALLALIAVAATPIAYAAGIEWRGNIPWGPRLAEFTLDVEGWEVVVVWYAEGPDPDFEIRYCGVNLVTLPKSLIAANESGRVVLRSPTVSYYDVKNAIKKYSRYNLEKILNYSYEQLIEHIETILSEFSDAFKRSPYSKALMDYRPLLEWEPIVLELAVRGSEFKEFRGGDVIDKGDMARINFLRGILEPAKLLLVKYNVSVILVSEFIEMGPGEERERVLEARDALESFIVEALAEGRVPDKFRYLFEGEWLIQAIGWVISLNFYKTTPPDTGDIEELVKWLRDNWGYCDVVLALYFTKLSPRDLLRPLPLEVETQEPLELDLIDTPGTPSDLGASAFESRSLPAVAVLAAIGVLVVAAIVAVLLATRKH